MKSSELSATKIYEQVHKEDPDFGSSSGEYLELICYVIKLMRGSGKTVNNVLDFGCGKSDLATLIAERCAIRAYKYDPAIKEIAKKPLLDEPIDLVINTDVLEHINESELSIIIEDIKSFSENVFFVIATRKARKILPNGENAHVTVKIDSWWKSKIHDYFHVALYLPSRFDRVTLITFKLGLINKCKLYLNFYMKYEGFYSTLVKLKKRLFR